MSHFVMFYIFGGCCANVYSLERLISKDNSAGSLITFTQFLLIALTCMSKSRVIPVKTHVLIVVLFFFSSLINNVAFSFNIPVPLHIVFRSLSTPISMLLSRTLLRVKYPLFKVYSVVLLTVGIMIFTLATTAKDAKEHATSTTTGKEWVFGISFLTLGVVFSCLLGIVQQKTFQTHGNHWKEVLFYSHFLALPLFSFVRSDIMHSVSVYNTSVPYSILGWFDVPSLWMYLIINNITQCLFVIFIPLSSFSCLHQRCPSTCGKHIICYAESCANTPQVLVSFAFNYSVSTCIYIHSFYWFVSLSFSC